MASILKVDTIQESTSGVGTNFATTGSASTPTISIGNQTNKGFYHSATDTIGISVGGSKVGQIGVGYGGFTGNVIQVRSSYWTTQVSTTTTLLTGHKISFTPYYSNSRLLFLLSAMLANTVGGTWSYAKIKNNTDNNYVNNTPRGVYSSAGAIYANVFIMDILTLSSIATKEYEIEISCSGNTAVYSASSYTSSFTIMEIQT